MNLARLPKGQGNLSVLPVRRTRWIAAIVGLWLVLLLALAAWWTTLVFQQARRIVELEAATGNVDDALARWERTRLMLAGESSFFLFLLLALSAGLAWLYWRENLRARSMQAFFASVTHELRTPLTSIRLQAEAIAEGEQRAELAQRLLEDSHRLELQIDRTLELARIEGGGPLAEQAIPLHSWLERVATDICAVYEERIDLEVQLDQSLPAIQADSAAVQMILRNLVENSVNHANVSPVRVQLAAHASGGEVSLDYQDNGRGVEGDVQQLGRLFSRGAASRGTGIGLYLVRALMERMGGRVQFHSVPGSGLRVLLHFKAVQD